MSNNEMELLIAEIKEIMAQARSSVAREVNSTMLRSYWEIGKRIVEREQNGELKAEYGKRLLTELSKRLTTELGKGYSRSNLYNMREVYLTYPTFQMPSGKLSWSHYIELVAVKDYNGSQNQDSELRILFPTAILKESKGGNENAEKRIYTGAEGQDCQ